jgi:hypothetical protein
MEITGVLAVAILLGVGRSKILPAAKGNRPLMWIAWLVTGFCGLMLGWALYGLVGWATSLGSTFGAVIGSVGALIAFILGWHGAYLAIALIRDLADKTPDDDARKAALWIPTFLPAGINAVWGVVSNPRGIGTGVLAAIMAAITVVYAHMIVTAALKGKTAAKGWKWFAAAVCLLAGVVMLPLVLFIDGVAADQLTDKQLLAARFLAGILGFALLIAACKDMFADKQPDGYVRAFLRFGLPLLLAFGTIAVTTSTGQASDGGKILTGTFK